MKVFKIVRVGFALFKNKMQILYNIVLNLKKWLFMNIITKQLILPEGEFDVKVQLFTEADRISLASIYKNWRNLCTDLQGINARGINLPEGLSEGAFCLEMNTLRVDSSINGANSSFDAYDLNRNKRIQIKACSVIPDLTSFGPSSVWDEIYFCDFCRQKSWDGSFDIYLINNDDIYNHSVNATQTLRDQQKLGRRPRFSIYKGIIQENNLQPLKTGKLF